MGILARCWVHFGDAEKEYHAAWQSPRNKHYPD